MPVRGQIYALDLGRVTGFCKGPPGHPPESGSWALSPPDGHFGERAANLLALLCDDFSRHLPDAVVVASPPSLQAFGNMGNSPAAVYSAYGLRAIVMACCARFEILSRYKEIHEATVRKHFTGKGRWGSREATKQAVLDRCHLIQLFPQSVRDEDRADACALHDWACATYGGRVPLELYLTGEKPRGGKDGEAPIRIGRKNARGRDRDRTGLPK